MKYVCPNKNSKEWKALEKKYGTREAYKIFIKNDYKAPIAIEKEISGVFGENLVKALEGVSKRIAILESYKLPKNDPELKKLRDTYTTLTATLESDAHKEGLMKFSETIADEIDEIDRIISNSNKGDVRNRSSRLRKSISFIDSTLPIIDDVTAYLAGKTMDAEEKQLYDVLSSKRAVLQSKRTKLIENGREVFSIFLEPFLGERNNPKILAEMNKHLPPDKQLKEFDLITALVEGDKDINFLNRWLVSMANTSNDILKLINEAVMYRKQAARLAALDDKYDLLEIRNKYFESVGFKDRNFDWVYERDLEGKLTGEFISERRDEEYRRDLRKYRLELLESYGAERFEDLHPNYHQLYLSKISEWQKANKDKYINQEYLKLNPNQLEALEALKEMKKELDSKLHPKHQNINRVPQVGKDFFERLMNIKNKGQIRELFASELRDRDYDIDQGDTSNTTDAEIAYVLGDRGREKELLPIHFTKKLDNMERDLSLDIISSMVVYSHMANDYQQMNTIIDALELGRDVLREQKVKESSFSGAVKKAVSYVGGTKIEKTLFKENSQIFDRYEDFLSMIVYGKTRLKGKNLKLFGKEVKIRGKNIDREKAIDLLGRYTAINALALNMYSGMSNILFGETMLRTEALAGQFFNEKDVIAAGVKYTKNVPSFLAQHGNVHNTSKMALWQEKFDVLQDYHSEKHKTDSNRKTWFARSMNLSSLFFLNHAGEHFMQTRTSYALANSIKLKDKDGKEISLFDAYEVKDGRLVLKQGVTKLDNSEWTIDDEIRFTRRQDYINQRMHGIYNQNDMAALQKYAVGRLGMMFRKFIVPGFQRRWEPLNYNYMVDSWQEGYYITTGRFLVNMMKDLGHMKFSLIKNWKDLSDLEKGNIRKTLVEVASLISATIVLNLLLGSGGGDDDDWFGNMLEYQARRLITEVWFFSNPNEALKILQSPSAAVSPIQNTFDFLGDMLNPFNWSDKIERGRYEDWYRWQKDLIGLMPMYRTVDKFFHPEEAVRWWSR